MSYYERLKPNDKIQERSIRLAAQYADVMADECRRQFEASPKLATLKPDTFEGLIARRRERSHRRFIAEREAGLRNDPESIGPGLNALVTYEAVAELASLGVLDLRGPAIKDPRILELARKAGVSESGIKAMMGETELDWTTAYKSDADPINLKTLTMPDGRTLHSMRLLVGSYAQAERNGPPKGILFHPHATFSQDRMVDSAPAFRLPAHSVVRIEGEAGELWQNPDYTSEGLPLIT